MSPIQHEPLDGSISLIRLDDGKVNAMNPRFFEALHAALDAAEAAHARAVVITGRPGRFSAGLDLKHVATLDGDGLQRFAAEFGRTMLRVFGFSAPIIAAVNGHAIAGGAILACACDVRMGLAGAGRFHLNEVEIGIPLPDWALTIATSAIPRQWHAPLLLHARALDPRAAFDAGVHDALADDEASLLPMALERARALARALNRGAYALSKQRLRGPEITHALERIDEQSLQV